MGETQVAPSDAMINMPQDGFGTAEEAADHQTQTGPAAKAERRNGMGNIFEGLDTAVLENLGLSQDMVLDLVAAATADDDDDDTVSERLTQLASHLSRESSSLDDDDCTCNRALIYRSFSATVAEEMQAAVKNRRRRNAVGNLFDTLSPAQQLSLVEKLQEQLGRLSCMCNRSDSSGTSTSSGSSNSSCDALMSLTNLSTFSASSTTSSGSSSPRSQSEFIVCP